VAGGRRRGRGCEVEENDVLRVECSFVGFGRGHPIEVEQAQGLVGNVGVEVARLVFFLLFLEWVLPVVVAVVGWRWR
jgi:hypothetical protein